MVWPELWSCNLMYEIQSHIQKEGDVLQRFKDPDRGSDHLFPSWYSEFCSLQCLGIGVIVTAAVILQYIMQNCRHWYKAELDSK
jgi:hypothetical protein